MDRLLKSAKTQRVVITHEVEKGSRLDLLVSGVLNGGLNRLADEIGDGLHAIALALSTKEDNSAQVLELTNKVKAVREKLKTAIDKQGD